MSVLPRSAGVRPAVSTAQVGRRGGLTTPVCDFDAECAGEHVRRQAKIIHKEPRLIGAWPRYQNRNISVTGEMVDAMASSCSLRKSYAVLACGRLHEVTPLR